MSRILVSLLANVTVIVVIPHKMYCNHYSSEDTGKHRDGCCCIGVLKDSSTFPTALETNSELTKSKLCNQRVLWKKLPHPFLDARSRSRMLPASPAHQEPAFCYTLIFQCIHWYINVHTYSYHRNMDSSNTPEWRVSDRVADNLIQTVPFLAIHVWVPWLPAYQDQQ